MPARSGALESCPRPAAFSNKLTAVFLAIATPGSNVPLGTNRRDAMLEAVGFFVREVSAMLNQIPDTICQTYAVLGGVADAIDFYVILHALNSSV